MPIKVFYTKEEGFLTLTDLDGRPTLKVSINVIVFVNFKPEKLVRFEPNCIMEIAGYAY